MDRRGIALSLILALLPAACGKPKAEPITADTATASASADPSAKPDDVEVTFALKHPEVGNKISDAETSNMEMHVSGRGKQVDLRDTEKKERIVEAVEVVDGRYTKLKVTYSKFELVRLKDGVQAATPALAGKTYVVARQGGTVLV